MPNAYLLLGTPLPNLWFSRFYRGEYSKTCFKQPLNIDKTKVLKLFGTVSLCRSKVL